MVSRVQRGCPGAASVERLAAQRRSNKTRTTTTRRRPTEPPPIQMALAKKGEDIRNIILLSFLRAIHSPSISTVTLLPALPFTSGGYPPNGKRFQAEPPRGVRQLNQERAATILPHRPHAVASDQPARFRLNGGNRAVAKLDELPRLRRRERHRGRLPEMQGVAVVHSLPGWSRASLAWQGS